MDDLETKLTAFKKMKYQWNEMHRIIIDYLLAPELAGLIDNTGKVHKVESFKATDGLFYGIELWAEKNKKKGFLNGIVRALTSPWETVINIYHNKQIFLCEYYLHRYFPLADKLQHEYNGKLKPSFGYDFVVVDKVP